MLAALQADDIDMASHNEEESALAFQQMATTGPESYSVRFFSDQRSLLPLKRKE